MKTVILAAGKGSRLGNLTESKPKSLLKLNENTTLLGYNLNSIKRIGIKEVIIVTGFERKQIEQYALKWNKNDELNIEFVFNPYWNYCNVLGSLYMALDKINDDFVFLHADTLCDIDVWTKLLNSKSNAALTVELKSCGNEEMKVIIHNKKIIDISKNINPNLAIGEFVGLAKFDKSLIDYFKKTTINLFEKEGLNLYMEAVLEYGIKKGEIIVNSIDVTEFNTIEIDFLEDLEKAQKMFE